jgi:hypothetical protein
MQYPEATSDNIDAKRIFVNNDTGGYRREEDVPFNLIKKITANGVASIPR